MFAYRKQHSEKIQFAQHSGDHCQNRLHYPGKSEWGKAREYLCHLRLYTQLTLSKKVLYLSTNFEIIDFKLKYKQFNLRWCYSWEIMLWNYADSSSTTKDTYGHIHPIGQVTFSYNRLWLRGWNNHILSNIDGTCIITLESDSIFCETEIYMESYLYIHTVYHICISV